MKKIKRSYLTIFYLKSKTGSCIAWRYSVQIQKKVEQEVTKKRLNIFSDS